MENHTRMLVFVRFLKAKGSAGSGSVAAHALTIRTIIAQKRSQNLPRVFDFDRIALIGILTASTGTNPPGQAIYSSWIQF